MNTVDPKSCAAARSLVHATRPPLVPASRLTATRMLTIVSIFASTLIASWPARAQSVDRTRLQACPYAVAELKSALAIDVKPGKGNEQPYPEGRLLGCSYSGTSGGPSVFVSQTWIPSKILAETQQSMDRYASGQFTPIARDPDGARWLADGQQKNQLALIYTRGNVRSELRLVGSRPLAADIQARMLKLRRVP